MPIRPIINSVIQPVVRSAVGVDDEVFTPIFTFEPKNATELATILAEYPSSAYTRNCVWNVKNSSGVWAEVAINVCPFENAGATDTDTISIPFFFPYINLVSAAQYRDFTHADWNATDCSITAGAVTLIDGTSISDKNTLTASGANATLILDPIASANAVHAGGLFVKRKTGVGTVEITIDGGTTWVDKTIEIDSDYVAEWHPIQTTKTVTNPEIGVRLGTSGDAVYLDWGQLAVGIPYVSDNPVAGGASLTAQRLFINSTELLPDAEGSLLVDLEVVPSNNSIDQGRVVGLPSLQSPLFVVASSNNAAGYDGTNFPGKSNAFIGRTKAASFWNAGNSTMQITSRGSSGSEGVYDGDWLTSSGFDIGSQQGSSYYANINLYSLKLYDQSKTASHWETQTEVVDDFDGYTLLAMGQSNMLSLYGGGGDLEPNSNVFVWSGSAWVVATSTTMGEADKNNIAFHFAKQLFKNTGKQVRIILDAYAGSPISNWVGAGKLSVAYASAMAKVVASGAVSIDYILWLQGEADYLRTVSAYATDHNTLMAQLRSESQISATTPFIAGQLRAGGTTDTQNGFYDDLATYSADNYIYTATCKELADVGDGTHYTGASLVTIGKERMIAVLP